MGKGSWGLRSLRLLPACSLDYHMSPDIMSPLTPPDKHLHVTILLLDSNITNHDLKEESLNHQNHSCI